VARGTEVVDLMRGEIAPKMSVFDCRMIDVVPTSRHQRSVRRGSGAGQGELTLAPVRLLWSIRRRGGRWSGALEMGV
jgi:hypothetical protein